MFLTSAGMGGPPSSAEVQNQQTLEAADKLDRKPEMLKTPAPEYPFAMRSNRLEGDVVVEFTVDATGRVRNAFAVKSSNSSFERSAIQAVEKWRFKPGIKDGRPVSTARVQQLITFRINDDGGSGWRVTKSKDHDRLPPRFQWETAPVPITTAYPVYPFDLLLAEKKGKVRIGCIVGPNGQVVKAEVQEASTPEMGLASLAMADAWQFIPAAKKDGTPCYAVIGFEHIYTPSGRDSVPVSEEALDILRAMKQHPEDIAGLQNLDRPLKPLSRRAPIYPTALIESGAPEGQALVEFFVDKNGDAQLPAIVTSTAREFGYAAVQAIAAWRFEPPMRDGRTCIVRVQVPVRFAPQAHPATIDSAHN